MFLKKQMDEEEKAHYSVDSGKYTSIDLVYQVVNVFISLVT